MSFLDPLVLFLLSVAALSLRHCSSYLCRKEAQGKGSHWPAWLLANRLGKGFDGWHTGNSWLKWDLRIEFFMDFSCLFSLLSLFPIQMHNCDIIVVSICIWPQCSLFMQYDCKDVWSSGTSGKKKRFWCWSKLWMLSFLFFYSVFVRVRLSTLLIQIVYWNHTEIIS